MKTLIPSHPELTLRPVTDSDHAFLLELYCSVRSAELEPAPWTQEQKHSFLESQFALQSRAYNAYDGQAYFIVSAGSQDIGRLYLQYRDDALSIVDISLLSTSRGLGYGTSLLQDVIQAANHLCRPVQIHVEKFNPAMRLYQRLGFLPVQDKEVYLKLERPFGQ